MIEARGRRGGLEPGGWRLAALVGLGLVLGLLIWPGLALADQQQARPVRVAEVKLADVPLYIDRIGNLTASSVVQVRSQISGELIKVHFQEGDEVKKGDLLFSIDPRPFAAKLDKALAAQAAGKVQLDEYQLKAKRLAELAKQDFVAKQNYDDAVSNAKVQAAQLQQDQADVALAKLQLGYCSIHASISGLTGLLGVKEGNLVSDSDENPLVTITQLDSIYADFNLPEKALPTVRRHLMTGPLKVEVSIEGDEDGPYEGRISFIDHQVQSSTGTFMMRGVLENPARRLWPGQFVKVRLILGRLKQAVLAPDVAVLMGQHGYYVFVVKNDDKVESRTIVPGERYQEMRVIKSGLAQGERVVTFGQLNLRPGMVVSIIKPNDKTAPKAKEAGEK